VASTTPGRPVAAARESAPGTDNHAAAYGHPADRRERRAITALVTRYYTAAAADDGVGACTLIYSKLAASVAEDYGRPPGPPSLRGSSCHAVMTKLFKQVPDQPPAVLARTRVTDVRTYGGRGFALLRSKAMPHGEIPVIREGSRWTVQWLIGREIGPGHP
jgi:hypothetical protein